MSHKRPTSTPTTAAFLYSTAFSCILSATLVGLAHLALQASLLLSHVYIVVAAVLLSTHAMSNNRFTVRHTCMVLTYQCVAMWLHTMPCLQYSCPATGDSMLYTVAPLRHVLSVLWVADTCLLVGVRTRLTRCRSYRPLAAFFKAVHLVHLALALTLLACAGHPRPCTTTFSANMYKYTMFAAAATLWLLLSDKEHSATSAVSRPTETLHYFGLCLFLDPFYSTLVVAALLAAFLYRTYGHDDLICCLADDAQKSPSPCRQPSKTDNTPTYYTSESHSLPKDQHDDAFETIHIEPANILKVHNFSNYNHDVDADYFKHLKALSSS